jgi:hypothetical protein
MRCRALLGEEAQRVGTRREADYTAVCEAYVKTNKKDAADAEAICEAGSRPNMRFVPIKYGARQAVLALHRARQGFVKARTAQANQIRGLLAEFGIVIPQGARPSWAPGETKSETRSPWSASPSCASSNCKRRSSVDSPHPGAPSSTIARSGIGQDLAQVGVRPLLALKLQGMFAPHHVQEPQADELGVELVTLRVVVQQRLTRSVRDGHRPVRSEARAARAAGLWVVCRVVAPTRAGRAERAAVRDNRAAV